MELNADTSYSVQVQAENGETPSGMVDGGERQDQRRRHHTGRHGVEVGADGHGGGHGRQLHGGPRQPAGGECDGDGRRVLGHGRGPVPDHPDLHRIELEHGPTVTVTAGDDADTKNHLISLTHRATSTDSDYSGITIAGVMVMV